jgi:hypothetical protein
VKSLGNLFAQRFGIAALVPRRPGEAGVEFPLQFVVKPHADDSAAAAFDLVGSLVIEPVEVRVVKGLFGLLEPVIDGLA